MATGFIYLFSNCILKTINEAVVEGMCKTVHKHASSERHLGIDRFAIEAVVDWAAPTTARATPVLTAAMNKTFNGKEWNFFAKTSGYQVSEVVDRKLKEFSKISFCE